ncbi:MAG: MmcQ/YjbR family DNA-binding protein, partial [Pseudoruegeria sp.]
VSVKTPDIETAQMLIEMERAIKAPYFHRSWIHVPWNTIPDDELRDRLKISYSIIRSGLTKKIQARLGVWPLPSGDE